MNLRRNESNTSVHQGVPRSRGSRVHGVFLFALLAAAPFVAGAKGCDQGVVGDECPKGSATGSARCGGTGGGGGGVDPGPTADGGSVDPTTCGGLRGVTCADGDYCNFGATCGNGDQTGTCAPKPEVCTEQYAPVCGCDGKTYGNACSAAGAGVSIAKTGECGTTTPPGGGTTVCGGLKGVTCGKGQYCDFPVATQCGATDQTGTCTDIPQVCDTLFHAVCGCDGKTYGNDCEAASQGVSIASDGACSGGGTPDAGPGPVGSCGGLLGATCPSDQYCSFPAGAQCGVADQTGTCTTKPQVCNDLAMPVCGCDGKTYPNACYAARSGTSVAASGDCAATPPAAGTCGGLRGLTCNKGEYCDFPVSTSCGSGDQTGTCASIPAVCDKVYSPVCGCDGNTYGNDCMAAAAGVAVMSAGACGGTTAASCGGRGTPVCPTNQFCNFPASAMCGVADASGTCAAKPQACTEVFSPVCGCDGHTYSNGCFANAAGVSVATKAACAAAP